MLTIKFLHLLAVGAWLGTALTLPFWGNRMNRAANLPMVLGISDTVFVLKNVFIMGGLVLTLGTGIYLTEKAGYGYFDFSELGAWLGFSQLIFVIITFNSILILYLMIQGRRGRRSYFRPIPPIGYNNIALIVLMFAQMTMRPALSQQIYYLGAPLAVLLALDLLYWYGRLRARQRRAALSAQDFATHYFGLLAKEDMNNFFRLFHDDAEFHDPFATHPIIGLINIEQFFQQLGDQFEDIAIAPDRIFGDADRILTFWTASGVTKNGEHFTPFSGANLIHLSGGKIKSVHIFFDPRQLPKVSRITLPAARLPAHYPTSEAVASFRKHDVISM